MPGPNLQHLPFGRGPNPFFLVLACIFPILPDATSFDLYFFFGPTCYFVFLSGVPALPLAPHEDIQKKICNYDPQRLVVVDMCQGG